LTWQTKHLFARIATQNSFLPKGNKLFTRKKVLKTNPRGAQIADARRNNKETKIAATMAATETTDGKKLRRAWLSFFISILISLSHHKIPKPKSFLL